MPITYALCPGALKSERSSRVMELNHISPQAEEEETPRLSLIKYFFAQFTVGHPEKLFPRARDSIMNVSVEETMTLFKTQS